MGQGADGGLLSGCGGRQVVSCSGDLRRRDTDGLVQLIGFESRAVSEEGSYENRSEEVMGVVTR